MTSAAIEHAIRPCGPYSRLVPAQQLKVEIERMLQAAPAMLWDLARAVGYSESVVRTRLLQLQDEQRAHRIESRHPVTNNRGFLWCAGPAPLADIDEAVGPAEIPQQATARNYPTIGRRDNLVAALFGPARLELA